MSCNRNNCDLTNDSNNEIKLRKIFCQYILLLFVCLLLEPCNFTENKILKNLEILCRLIQSSGGLQRPQLSAASILDKLWMQVNVEPLARHELEMVIVQKVAKPNCYQSFVNTFFWFSFPT